MKSNKKNQIEVFSMFDIFVEYLEREDYSAIFFIDIPIYEALGGEVTGRACGDRVAVISCSE